LVAGAVGTAQAKTLDWSGTMVLDLGVLPSLVAQGSGVATVNNSSGGEHLNTLRIAGGITGNTTVPVTDPEVTGTIKSVAVSGAALGTGTISGISAASPIGGVITGQRTLGVSGFAKVCLVFTGCPNFLPLALSQNGGNTGIGIGGLLTIGGQGSIRISIEANPWTIGTGMGISQTDNGGFITKTRTGFAHGPNSNTSTTAARLGSGLIQLISPMQVVTSGVPGNSEKLQLFATLTIHFIPEPGLMLLLGSGVVGLVLVGRHRMRK
jgi:hypothetical protein